MGCVMTTKNDAIGEFNNFCQEHSKISKICFLMDCFGRRYIMFEFRK